MSKPVTIGRIVEFHEPDKDPRPAIVTHVHSQECVSVVVFDAFHRVGCFPSTSLRFEQERQPPGASAYVCWPDRDNPVTADLPAPEPSDDDAAATDEEPAEHAGEEDTEAEPPQPEGLAGTPSQEEERVGA